MSAPINLMSEWQQVKADYALPDSTVDIGNMYHYARAFEEKLADTMRENKLLHETNDFDKSHIDLLQSVTEQFRKDVSEACDFIRKGKVKEALFLLHSYIDCDGCGESWNKEPL